MNKNKSKNSKQRDWLAVHAKGLTGRRGAGAHKDKSKYNRKQKHKRGYQ